MKHLYQTAVVMLLVSAAALPGGVAAQRILYVDAGASGADDGSVWADAFNDLQAALAEAVEGDEIWVAEGLYQPVVPVDSANVTDVERDATFALKNGVAIYGGFASTETRRDERNMEAFATILSGDLLGNDNDILDIDEPTRAENSYHVVRAGVGVGATTVLDGFTITAGNANLLPPRVEDKGGGFYGLGTGPTDVPQPMLRNVVFTANTARFGGGMGNTFASPTVINAVFIDNVAAVDGGGIHNFWSASLLKGIVFRNNIAEGRGGGSSPVGLGGGLYQSRGGGHLTNITFVNNMAVRGGGMYTVVDKSVVANTLFLGNQADEAGGGMYNDAFACEDCNLVIINVVFSGNRTLGTVFRGGGGIYNFRADLILRNVTFSGNTAANEGGAIHNVNSTPTLFNTILWGNRAARAGNQIFNRNSLVAPPEVFFSIIEGGVPEGTNDGGNNLDADPFFVDADGPDDIPGTDDDDLRLLAGSPAIDAGLNSAVVNDYLDFDLDGDTSEPLTVDLDGHVRIYDGGIGEAIVDLGAYEFGAPPVVLVAVEDPAPALAEAPLFLAAYPNPFRGQATLRYALPVTGRVVMKVYDMLGREIITLVDAILPAGTHEVRFEAPHLASGLYLYHLEAAGRTATRKMLLVK